MDHSSLHSQMFSQQAMAVSSTLASGQSYYTLESLEGASSLPFLKPAPPGSLARRESLPTSLPLPLERLDAQARALLADREILDARARLLAAEREALLRNVPGGASGLQEQRMYKDGLQAVDARARLSLDGLQNVAVRTGTHLDSRAFSHGLDARPGISSLPDHRSLSHGIDLRPGDPVQPGVVNIPRVLPVVGGIAPGHTEHGSLAELLRARELGVGGPFLSAADPMLARRDISNWRTEVPTVGAQNVHLLTNGSRELPAMRFGHAEGNKVKFQAERNKGVSISHPVLFAKPPAAKIKLPPEQSEGWCGVCKIDCHNIKTLGIHVNGRKHKAAAQGNTVKVDVASTTPSTSQADKKRASDEKLEQSAKRLKASSSTTPMVAATEVKKAKVDSQKAKPPPAVISPSQQFCKICNITTTGKSNLESHLKGKRHAARVKELANPQLVSAT